MTVFLALDLGYIVAILVIINVKFNGRKNGYPRFGHISCVIDLVRLN